MDCKISPVTVFCIQVLGVHYEEHVFIEFVAFLLLVHSAVTQTKSILKG
jgi:hypothetical protein